MNWNNSQKVLLQKPDYYYLSALNEFYLAVSNQLFYQTNKAVRNYYGQLLYGDYNKSDELSIGTKVETVLSDNVSTIRSGFVIGQGYSKNWGAAMYTIFTEGKRYNKWYRKEDLVKREEESYDL